MNKVGLLVLECTMDQAELSYKYAETMQLGVKVSASFSFLKGRFSEKYLFFFFSRENGNESGANLEK